MEKIATDTYSFERIRAGKKVTLAGVAFDAEMRNLSDRQIEVAGNVGK